METTTQKTLAPEEIANGIREGWKQFMLRFQQSPYNANNVYAGSFHECTRNMALNLVAGDRVLPYEASTLANFRRGKDRERNLLSDLALIGRDATPSFEVIGHEERFQALDNKGRVIVSGKVDCRLKINGTRKLIPTEVKSWNLNIVAQIREFEDLFNNQFTQRGAYQLLTYMYASNEELGIMILDRHGLPLILPVFLSDDNLDRLTNFLKKSEEALDAKELVLAAGGFSESQEVSNLLPPYITDSSVCRNCRFFGHTCNPPIKNEGAHIVVDDYVIEAVQKCHELKPAHKEFDDNWEIVKDALRGMEKSIMPGFSVDGVWQKNSGWKIPPKPTPEEKAEIDAFKKKFYVTDPKGKFKLTINKLD